MQKMNNPDKYTKIVFFGTSDRSLPILESLKSNFDLELCVTKKNTLFGRDQVEKETEVKRWATTNNVDTLLIDSLKDNNLEYVLDKIKSIKPDYGIVADFSFMIPKKVIETFNGNLINIHFSLLPKYRGASPVQHAILNGDEKTGITFYLLNEKMDDGDIISKIEYYIDSKYTSGELYDLLFKISADELPNVIKGYSLGELIPYKQLEEEATYTISKTNPKHTFIFKEDAQIDWKQPPEIIERSIRAYNPWPIAWSYLVELENSTCLSEKIILKNHVNKNLKVKIFKAEILGKKLQIEEIQVEGKNKTEWKSFKNGYVEKTI